MKGALIFALICCIPALIASIYLVIKEKRNPEEGKNDSESDTDSDVDLGSDLMLGAMGAKLLDDQLEKEKRESERKNRELFYWQDAAREKEEENEEY